MESIPRTSGIYQILCIPTGKVYIGSAVNLRKRHREHLQDLRNGTHANRYLQHAWSKYGESAFELSILELVMFPEYLIEREQYWLDATKAHCRDTGFNISPTAGSSLGVKRSEAFIEKMRIDRTGRKASEEARRKQSESRTGKKLPPFSEARRKGISDRARKRYSDPALREAIHGKRWELVSPEGEIHTTGNLAQFARDLGLLRRSLAYVATGKLRHHRGWVCRLIHQE